MDTQEKQDKVLREVMISPGYPSLEFVFAGKPPFHTYEEMPIIKLPESAKEEH